MRLYVGNLSWNTTEQSLREGFEKFGPINDAVVITDRDTGRSRGFGFVTFDSADDGNEAMSEMNGTDFEGRNIKVNEAREKRRGGGGGGGQRDGGYGDRW